MHKFTHLYDRKNNKLKRYPGVLDACCPVKSQRVDVSFDLEGVFDLGPIKWQRRNNQTPITKCKVIKMCIYT